MLKIRQRTEVTALSSVVDAEPPKLRVAIDGLPEDETCVATQSKPETLQRPSHQNGDSRCRPLAICLHV